MGKKWNNLVGNKTISFFGRLGSILVAGIGLVGWIVGWWEEEWSTVKSWFPWLVGCVVVYTVFWLVLVSCNVWRKLSGYLRDRQYSKRLRQLRPLMEDCKSFGDQATKDRLRNHLSSQLIDMGVISPATSGMAAQTAWDLLLGVLLRTVDSDRRLPIREARKRGIEYAKFWLDLEKAIAAEES